MTPAGKRAARLARSVKVTLIRCAKLASDPSLVPSQKHFLHNLRAELLRADIRCEGIDWEFKEKSSPLIIGQGS